MKVVMVVLILMLLVACANEPKADVQSRLTGFKAERIHVIADSETGCQYLLYISNYAGSMTPMLNAEGKPTCGK